MIRPRLLACVLAASSLACSGGDRLAQGVETMADSKNNLNFIRFQSPLSRGRMAPDVALIADGTKIRVIEDAAPDDPRHPGERPVRVLVLEGEQGQVVGTVRRRDLSPIR